MSTLKVDTLKNGSSSAIDFPQNLKVGGAGVIQGYTVSSSEPSSPTTGDFWWNSSDEKLYRYINGEFKEITVAPSVTNYGDRGFSIGDYNETAADRIHYWDISTASNAALFGNLIQNSHIAAACTSGVYAFRCGGSNTNSSSQRVNTIERWTCATTGNSSDFGDLTATCFWSSGHSDGTTGIVNHGQGSSYNNNIDKFTMATAGNATDFGDTTAARSHIAVAANLTRMVNMGGQNASGTKLNTIDYITIASAGNATDFGDLIAGNMYHAGMGTGSGNRALSTGGRPASSYYDGIEYIDIDTPGNATDAGNLLTGIGYHGATSNATKGHAYGGYSSSGEYGEIQQTILATGANATDHGDLLIDDEYQTSTSGNAS